MVTSPKPKMWFGQIEDIFDPLEIGRYRVRVHGYNTTDDTILPTEDLQWFPIVTPNNAANRGVGISPTFFDVGTIVLGMYLDDENQNGIILGSAHSYDYGNSDVSGFARGGLMENQMSQCDGKSGDVVQEATADVAGGETDTPKQEEKKQEQEKIKLETTGSYNYSPKTIADLDKLLTNKNIQIFMELVRWTEGTGSVPNCYYTMYTGRKFTNLSTHPNIENCANGYCSTAAGAYQAVYPTWMEEKNKFKFSDFGFKNQDRFCVARFKYRKAIKLIVEGNWVQAMIKCIDEWVSLPGTKIKQSRHLKTQKQCLDFIKKRGGVLSAQDNTITQPVDGMNPNVAQNSDGSYDYKQITNDMAMSCGNGNIIGENGSQFPISRGSSQYPYNKTMTTNSGHVIEIDDTPNNERINIYHKSGSYISFQPNGDVFHKSVSNAHTLILEDDNRIVSGVQNVTILGNANLNIGGVWNVKADEANFDIPIIRQAGEYYCNEAIVQGTKFTEHQHKGVTSGGDLSLEPLVDGVVVGSMAVETATYSEIRLSKSSVERHVRDGLMTKEDAELYERKPSEIPPPLESDDKTPPKKEYETSPCGKIPRLSNGRVDLKSKMGKYHNFGYFIGGAAGKHHSFKAQRGLTEEQIYCNMKNLIENCYDKIKDKFPDAMNNSCLRNQASNSNHQLGIAIDIGFAGLSKSQYYERAKWIRDNIAFDALLLEYKGKSSCWLHMQLRRSGNRGMVATWLNDGQKKYTGLKKLI